MMVIIFLFHLLLIHVSGSLYGPRLMISHVGGSVTIKCYYSTTSANKHDRKYWCKESSFSRGRCQVIVSTNHFTLQDYEGRVSIKDSPHNGLLQITMTQLKRNDSSNYRCGIGKSTHGLFAGVNVTIWEGLNLPEPPKIIWGKLRGSVMIQCPSETTGELCKLSKLGCSPIRKISKGRMKQLDERITFTVIDISKTFNITINELRKEDSGIYKCGTEVPNDFGKMIQLQVTEASVFSNIANELQGTSVPETSFNRHVKQDTYESETPSHRHVTSATDISKERSSQTKQNFISIILPILLVLILVLAAIAIAVFIKIRQQRKFEISTQLKGKMALADPKCSEEQLKEENNASADEEESTTGTGKDGRVETIYCLVSNDPDPTQDTD
ncbi:polymeric immunoglobulin receptor-like [Anolis sagrei]|uniref:polymeric immunoglobulin receptor-like n=1 Tax=Anolis sagrei TaxID=38937 RepID=UPI003520023B